MTQLHVQLTISLCCRRSGKIRPLTSQIQLQCTFIDRRNIALQIHIAASAAVDINIAVSPRHIQTVFFTLIV